MQLSVKNLLLTMLVFGLFSCASNSQTTTADDLPSRSDTQLVLNNAILEQSNKQENTVWKIKAKSIVYTEDKQKAILETVTGNLWQGDEIILKISAESGEVVDNGDVIFLKDNIVATATQNGTVVRSNNIEWRPQENTLIVSDNLSAVNTEMEVVAKSGKYHTDREQLELETEVIATVFEPALQLTSDRLTWNIPLDLAIIPSNLEIVRYQEDETISDRVVAERAKIELTKKIATLTDNIELVSLDPKLQIATNSLSWNYERRIGIAEQPIQIIDRDRQLDITGNRGEINFPEQIARLSGGVKGLNTKDVARLYARELVWNLDTEIVEANGSVAYQQTKPQVNLTGEKAVGNIAEQNIVVSGGKKQVTSTIEQ